MTNGRKVSLQINLAPSDYEVARWVLPHQLRRLQSQVDEIVLTLESRASRGRFSDSWQRNKKNMSNLIGDVESRFGTVHVKEVNYAKEKNKEIANRYLLSGKTPAKDFRGGPFYSYFFGIYECKYDYVFHLDSDIMLGGDDEAWVSRAIETLETCRDVFSCSPLAGPPRPDGVISQKAEESNLVDKTHTFSTFSTRVFFFDRRRLEADKLQLTRPRLRDIATACVDGNELAELPEQLLTRHMRKHRIRRVDFLGAGHGLWSLHPPYKSQRFFDRLPKIVEAVEQNQMPFGQLGHYDIQPALFDFSDEYKALTNNRWWRRLSRRIGAA